MAQEQDPMVSEDRPLIAYIPLRAGQCFPSALRTVWITSPNRSKGWVGVHLSYRKD